MKNIGLIEESQVKQIVAPGTDMNAAAITGARVALKDFEKATIMILMGTSVGAVVQATLRQHNAASGGTSKDLEVINAHYYKAGAADIFTKVEPTAARALIDASAQFAADEGILAVEVRSEDLDNDNGFHWLSVDLADSTAAKLVAGVVILGEPRRQPAYNVATL